MNRILLISLACAAMSMSLVACGGGGGGGNGGGGNNPPSNRVATTYRLIAIPLMGGATENGAFAVNDDLQVVGSAGPAGATKAFYWDEHNGLRSLHASTNPPTAFSNALDISEAGDGAGVLTLGGWTRGFYSFPNASDFVDPDTADNDINTAWAINNNRVVVGGTGDTQVSLRAYRWTQATGMQLLPNTSGATAAEALDINTRGDVVGYSFGADLIATIWAADGTIRTFPLNGRDSVLHAINTAGTAVGSNGATAFYVPYGGAPQTIALPAGSSSGEMMGISDGGVAGGWRTSGGVDSAIAWSQLDGAVLLQSRLDTSGAGWTLNRVHHVSANGTMAGEGTLGGQRRAIILIPRT